MSIFLLLAAAAAPVTATDDTPPEGVIVVTASRSGDPVPAATLGASVTVIDDAALEARQTRLVSDVLRDVPGVAVSRVGAVGGMTQVRIRGSEANHVLVLIDGIEVSDPFQGEFDFGTLTADQGATVEVLRGQQSSLYGSDAIGGVILYRTLSGREAPGVQLRAEGGSFGTGTAAARAAGVSGAVDYSLTSSYYHTGGTPTARNGDRDIGSDVVGATAKLGWTPSEAFKLTAVGRYGLTDAETNDSSFDFASPLFGTIVDTPGAHFRNEAYYGLVRADLSLLDGRWTNALTGQIADTDRRNYDSFGLSFGDKGRRTKGSFDSTLRFGGDALAHKVTAAVDVERESFRYTSPASPFVFTGRRHTDNVGLVGQYELTAGDRASFGASIRHDANDRFADATTFRVQGSVRLLPETRVRAAYGTGVKNPLYFELFGFSDGRYIGNPDLKPEKSKGWEAGIEQSLAAANTTIGATYFDNRLTDEIFLTPTFPATSDNRITESKQRGVELFASARPNSQLRFDLAYTYLHARENGTVEIRRPKHIASANVTGSTADQRLSATLTVRYNGRQDDFAFTDPSFVPVRVSLKEYVLVNLAADYRLTDRLSLFGRVENLLSEDYEEVFSYATPGRAAYAGARLRF